MAQRTHKHGWATATLLRLREAKKNHTNAHTMMFLSTGPRSGREGIFLQQETDDDFSGRYTRRYITDYDNPSGCRNRMHN